MPAFFWLQRAVGLVLGLLSFLLLSCAHREESLLVTVRSNHLPDGLFDRLTIELRRPGALESCSGCQREFPAQELTQTGLATFAVASPGGPLSVRVSLSRARGKPPRKASSVAVVASLNPQATDVEVRLSWDAVGTELGSWEQPFEPALLPPISADPLVGQGCKTPHQEGQVCIPGGLFWLGDPSIDLLGGVDREGTDERLVLLSPFWIDAAEVTVGQMRTSGLASGLLPIRHEVNPACTYTQSPKDREALPVTCVTWPLASDFCEQQGRRLPTEAELEFLMGGLRSRRFVWGDDAPECDDAVFGETDCARSGPEIAGSGRLDRLALEGGTVVDLTGNALEWAGDQWNSTKEACFTAPLLRDPFCKQDSPSQPGRRVVRGGGWLVDRSYLGAPLRFGLHGELTFSEGLGFRCARGGT